MNLVGYERARSFVLILSSIRPARGWFDFRMTATVLAVYFNFVLNVVYTRPMVFHLRKRWTPAAFSNKLGTFFGPSSGLAIVFEDDTGDATCGTSY